MRAKARAAVLVCVLVLTGCSGVGGGLADAGGSGASEDGDTADVTPAPVPAVEERERLAPGLTTEGIENASTLAAAHDAVLRNRSFTLRTNRTTTYANGSLRGRTAETVRVVPEETAFETTEETNGTVLVSRSADHVLVRNERWFDGKRGLERVMLTNDTTGYYRFEGSIGPAIVQAYVNGGDRYERLFGEAETRVGSRVERNGTTLYRLTASDISSAGLLGLPWFESVENVTFEAFVSSAGLVYRHRLAYTVRTENGSAFRVVESVRYSDIGSTTVTRPSWYDEALERTNATSEPDTNASTRRGATN